MRLRRDKIVVALEPKVLVYNFADLRLLDSIETLSNPSGLLALSPVSDQTVLACPGIKSGQVGARGWHFNHPLSDVSREGLSMLIRLGYHLPTGC